MSNGIEQNPTEGNDITDRLVHIWEALLDVRPIKTDDNYFDLGGDSLLAVQLFAQLEMVFDVKLPLVTLFEAPTIGELAKIIEREAPKSRWSSLVIIQPKGWRPPLFCMHGAGGNVLIYRELSKRLGDEQPFYGLQSPVLDGNGQPHTRIEDMASVYVREIRSVQPRGPYYVGGYCFGGTIAYEVAQQLCAQGEEVALLALIDTHNWSKLPIFTLRTKAVMAFESMLFHVLNYLRLDTKGKREFRSQKFRILRDRIPHSHAFLSTKLAYNSSLPKSNLALLGKIWTANSRASMEYVPKPYPGVVTDFRPLRQYSVYMQANLKWEKLARGGQRIVQLPVYPAGMMVEPFVKLLAEALKKSIDSAMNQ
jgi:phthiocerol/phenolphthiocerol synthesis type-I polyketide synthase E